MTGASIDNLLRCPSCGNPFAWSGDAWHCSACKAEYGYTASLPDFTPRDAAGISMLEREHYTDKID